MGRNQYLFLITKINNKVYKERFICVYKKKEVYITPQSKQSITAVIRVNRASFDVLRRKVLKSAGA